MENTKNCLNCTDGEAEFLNLLITHGLIRVLEQAKAPMTPSQIVEAYNSQSDNGIKIEWDKGAELLSKAAEYSEITIFEQDYFTTKYISNDCHISKFAVIENPDNGELESTEYFSNIDDAKKYALEIIYNYNFKNNASVYITETEYDGGTQSSRVIHSYRYCSAIIDTETDNIIEYY